MGSHQALPRAFGHSPLGDRGVLSLSTHHPAWFSGTVYLIPSPCSEVTARSAGQNLELQTQATAQQLGQRGCFCSLGANAQPALFSVNLQLCPAPEAEIQARHSYLPAFLTCST